MPPRSPHETHAEDPEHHWTFPVPPDEFEYDRTRTMYEPEAGAVTVIKALCGLLVSHPSVPPQSSLKPPTTSVLFDMRHKCITGSV